MQIVTKDEILRRRWESLKTRSERDDIPFEITANDLIKIWDSQDGLCAMTGIPLSIERRRGPRGFPPHAVAVDLISPALGYVPGNCRLVIFAVARILSCYGEEKLKEIALAYVSYRLQP